jgi:hypothetical protein
VEPKLLPEDFCPTDRAQAAVLAHERGCAWYMPQQTGRPHIYFVQKDTPLIDEGEDVLWCNTWSKREALEVVRELNRAHLIGFQNGHKMSVPTS